MPYRPPILKTTSKTRTVVSKQGMTYNITTPKDRKGAIHCQIKDSIYDSFLPITELEKEIFSRDINIKRDEIIITLDEKRNILFSIDGSIKEGVLNNGKLNGEGLITNPDGTILEGKFENDKLNGEGKITYANGTIFEGKFENNRLNGKGKIIYNDGELQEGIFNDNALSGEGKITYSHGGTKEGLFRNGTLIGKGKMTFTDGDTIEGEFKNDKLQGKGKIQSAQYKVEGDFKDNVYINPYVSEVKKDQTILLIQPMSRTLADTTLQERYNKIILFNEVTKMDASLLASLITKPTKKADNGKKVKIKIISDGYKSGEVSNEKFISETLKSISKEIKKYNKLHPKEKITKINIGLSASFGTAVVMKNNALKNIFKEYVNSGIEVGISAGDENQLSSALITNNKNNLPAGRTDEGYFLINEFTFKTLSDLENIRPSKQKKYKNEDDFLKDSYEGKQEDIYSKKPLSALGSLSEEHLDRRNYTAETTGSKQEKDLQIERRNSM